jgi:Ca2+-binding EF-hand superfamily protein
MSSSTFHEKYKSSLPDNFEELARMEFYKYDADKNGYIEKKELERLLKQIAVFLGIKQKDVAKQEIRLILMEEFDTNQDGKISFSEFLNYFAMVYIDRNE